MTLWSRYKRVQEIITNPIQPLVVLIGPLYATTALKKIINDQTKLMRQQAAQAAGQVDMPETSQHNLKVSQYDFYRNYRSPDNPDCEAEMPTFYKEQLGGFSSGLFKKTTQSELGYLKLRFFDSVSIFKPAVTVMLFDWQHEPAASFDWVRREEQILNELKSFQEKCAVTATGTRIILLILMPLQNGSGPGEVQIDKCRASLRSALAASGNTNQVPEGEAPLSLGVKHYLLMGKGVEGLKVNPKDFIKKILEQTN